MNLDAITKQLEDFVRRHSTAFWELSTRQSMLLELSAIIGVEEHFAFNGFEIKVINPDNHDTFVVKTGTRGKPWKYSRILAIRNDLEIEAHMNLVVRGAHDEGIYCVDVGIISPGAVPVKDPGTGWSCVENEYLYSFAEVKRLAIYPMLLAHFIGIVHEIKPEFLRPPLDPDFGAFDNLPPSLIVLGTYSGNARNIVDSFEARGIQVRIVENYDVRLAVSQSEGGSPFYWLGEVK